MKIFTLHSSLKDLTFAVIVLLTSVPRAWGLDQNVPLTEEAVFHRCYGQIVRKRAPSTHPLLLQVKAGTLSAIDACMAVLAKGDLVKQGTAESYQLASPTDAESKAVLKTMHDFHRGWIEAGKFPDQIYGSLTHQIDLEEAAGYFTRALFGSSVRYSSVVQENRAMKILRNKGNFMEYFPNPNAYGESFELQQGEVTGLSLYPSTSTSWWNRSNVEQTQMTALYGGQKFNSKRSYGGGIMGLQTFLWGHVGYPYLRDTADGGVRIPRRWAKTIFSTLMCREIPLVRTSDVSDQVAAYKVKFPNPATHIPFRPNSNCMSCHASLDPLGSAVRNMTFVRTDASDTDRQAHIMVAGGLTTTADEAAGFHLVPTDTSFHRRPANTQLFYRSYDGTLINENISATTPEDALTKLGTSIAAKNDLYMCAASRYFQFFTGVKANLLDYQDPRNGGQISEADLHYRNLVKGLADGLKNDTNQSVKKLIRNIFSLPLYKTESMRDIKP